MAMCGFTYCWVTIQESRAVISKHAPSSQSYLIAPLSAVDSTADGTKLPCNPEKAKDGEKASQARDKEAGNDGDEGPSAVVKEEESKDGAESASKEAAADMETAADNKPPGDKYSPKVSVRKRPVKCSIVLSLLCKSLSHFPPTCSPLVLFGSSCQLGSCFFPPFFFLFSSRMVIQMYNMQTAVNHIPLLAGAAGTAQVCRGRHSQLWGVPEGGSGEEKEIQSMRTLRELVTRLLGTFFAFNRCLFCFHFSRLMIRGGPIITMSSSALLYQCWPKKVNVCPFSFPYPSTGAFCLIAS